MSAWPKCSLDPIQGADKRNEQYWDQVGKTYNDITSTGRSRNQNQVKDRWHMINKLADLFHSAYLKSQALNTSGFNEEMWVAEAHKWYVTDTGLPRILLGVSQSGKHTIRASKVQGKERILMEKKVGKKKRT
jgi:hypothetical protein